MLIPFVREEVARDPESIFEALKEHMREEQAKDDAGQYDLDTWFHSIQSTTSSDSSLASSGSSAFSSADCSIAISMDSATASPTSSTCVICSFSGVTNPGYEV